MNLTLFKTMEVRRYVPWRQVFRDLGQLRRWIQFQLVVVYGRQTLEIANTAVHPAKAILRIYRSSDPLFTSFYLKMCVLALKRSITSSARFTYAPSKNPLVSLTASGFPRIILPKHRKVIRRGGPRAEALVRVYLTVHLQNYYCSGEAGLFFYILSLLERCFA